MKLYHITIVAERHQRVRAPLASGRSIEKSCWSADSQRTTCQVHWQGGTLGGSSVLDPSCGHLDAQIYIRIHPNVCFYSLALHWLFVDAVTHQNGPSKQSALTCCHNEPFQMSSVHTLHFLWNMPRLVMLTVFNRRSLQLSQGIPQSPKELNATTRRFVAQLHCHHMR